MKINTFICLTFLFCTAFFLASACTSIEPSPKEEPLQNELSSIQKQKKVTSFSAPLVYGNKSPRFGESGISNLVTDAMMWGLTKKEKQKVDFSLINAGIIQEGLPQGEVTQEDFYKTLPFETKAYLVTLTGEEVLNLFDYIASINQGSTAFAQVSKEVTYSVTYDERGKNGSITSLLIHNKEINPELEYRIATTDYLAAGGDGYTDLQKGSHKANTSITLQDLVIEYAKSLEQPISPTSLVDSRLNVIGGKSF